MTNLGVVFLTGLTTGGLSCLAVQGGLLASSIARQAEQDIQQQLRAPNPATCLAKQAATRRKQANVAAHSPVRSIVLFLAAKLVAYTLLGFLLGWLGSMLQLTPAMRGIMQTAIGIFMVGTALRMFNVHPFFRFFVFEPPAFLTRYIRKTARSSTHAILTPLFLGALTVLIPCGVTQAMMALAIGTGSPLLGAAIMAAFTLGTSPVFFTLAYVAIRLGKRLEARFLQIAATVVLLLGLVSIDGGLNLLGAPISFASLKKALKSAMTDPARQQTETNVGQVASGNVVTITVADRGYMPEVVRVKAGQPVKLALVTNNTHSCIRAFVLPSLGVERILPKTGTTIIALPAQKAGTVPFTCSMGMYQGYIQFE